jgi:sigma-B regulation protein RsbU (phosphoserine phosphatase)
MTVDASILLIDDDRILRHVLHRTLSLQGAEVSLASSGEEGLQLARRVPVQLVICDWCMAGMDGLEVCRQFKADPELAPIFFILLTSRSEVKDRVLGLDAGADDFLSKPVDSAELLARVRAGLRLYESNRHLREVSRDLAQQKQLLEQELASAADYVRSLLPQPLRGDVDVDRFFLPSQQLGGDCLDFFWLDDNHLLLYILDVSGHGLAAALPSISIHNLLRNQAIDQDVLCQPEKVLSYLNQFFQMERQNNQYFTIWYGIYNQASGMLSYAAAGHPPALLVSAHQAHPVALTPLRAAGLPIGMFREATYECHHCRIEPPTQLFLYSDGMYEIPQANGQMWDLPSFTNLLQQRLTADDCDLSQLLEDIHVATGMQSFADDASLIAVRFHGSTSASFS